MEDNALRKLHYNTVLITRGSCMRNSGQFGFEKMDPPGLQELQGLVSCRDASVSLECTLLARMEQRFLMRPDECRAYTALASPVRCVDAPPSAVCLWELRRPTDRPISDCGRYRSGRIVRVLVRCQQQKNRTLGRGGPRGKLCGEGSPRILPRQLLRYEDRRR